MSHPYFRKFVSTFVPLLFITGLLIGLVNLYNRTAAFSCHGPC